jgi:hypothetical protein
MKLFDTKPKSDPHVLYGREKELDTLEADVGELGTIRGVSR